MKRNIFIPALTELQRQELATVRHADEYTFHGLLDTYPLIDAPNLDFDELLARAREQLAAFDGSIDAIIAHWDFPTSMLVPILCRDHGIASPSLESVLKCEHKYWSRVEQRKSIPELAPAFFSFDPFGDDPLSQIGLDFPFWIKPVKSFGSQLGFKIHNADDFHRAMDSVRAEIPHIGRPFDQALAHADVPEDIRHASGCTCVAEQIIAGDQSAPEGSVFQGEVKIHGILDMAKDEQGRTFDRLEYPSTFPAAVQARMIDACERFLTHIGFDNGCFNAEFMWDRQSGKLWLIEFNTRISQSHCEMFIDVDGMSNHEVAIDVALGIRPDMPYRKGNSQVAAKFIISHFEDAVVTRAPSAEQLQQLKSRFPNSAVLIDVKPGMRLSELPNQDSYSYHIGTLFLGADSHAQLLEQYRTCLEILQFDFAPPNSQP